MCPSKGAIRSFFVRGFGLAVGLPSACWAIDFTQPWNPSAPLPAIITHDYVAPVNVAAIARYRSGVGHSFSDNYEAPDRSLKFYFEPLKRYLGTQYVLPVYVPASGTIVAVNPEEQVLSNGDIRGNQVTIDPDGYPAFEIRCFHLDLNNGLGVGSHVNAGDPLGYADIRESVDFDLAVGAAWNAVQVYPDSGQSTAPPGYRLLSPGDVMNSATFGHMAAYGITDPTQLVVPLAYRNANPGQFGSYDLYTFNPTEFAVFQRAPDLGSEPTSLVLDPGSSGYFEVDAAAQGLALTYQWLLNGAPVSDGTTYTGSQTAILSFYNAGSAQAGNYTVQVSNIYGTTVSDPANLNILANPVAAPVITSQPASQTVASGSTVTLSVGVTGSMVNYQWRFNGGYIYGATSATLTLTNVGAAQAGAYSVLVSNPGGSAVSNDGVLTVNVAPPAITAQPANVSTNPNYAITFTVTASGTGLSFLWYHNSQLVISSPTTNATIASTLNSSTLTLYDVKSADAGPYTASISNTAGTVTSNAASLTITNPSAGEGSSGGGGGGGAPSAWFLGVLALLAGVRTLGRRPLADRG